MHDTAVNATFFQRWIWDTPQLVQGRYLDTTISSVSRIDIIELLLKVAHSDCPNV